MGVTDRFWAKVDRRGPGECWEWTACRIRGYGQFVVSGGRRVRAPRFAYELMVGPIPDGLVIDHRCDNPPCVNPAHLEVVSMRENTLRGRGPTAVAARRTHCPQGHPYVGANLHVRPKGWRSCRICGRQRCRDYRARVAGIAA